MTKVLSQNIRFYRTEFTDIQFSHAQDSQRMFNTLNNKISLVPYSHYLRCIRYRCIFVRSSSDLPATAGDAPKNPSNSLTANT